MADDVTLYGLAKQEVFLPSPEDVLITPSPLPSAGQPTGGDSVWSSDPISLGFDPFGNWQNSGTKSIENQAIEKAMSEQNKTGSGLGSLGKLLKGLGDLLPKPASAPDTGMGSSMADSGSNGTSWLVWIALGAGALWLMDSHKKKKKAA